MTHCDMFKSFPVISWNDTVKKAPGRVKTDVRNDDMLTFQTDASEIECDRSNTEEETTEMCIIQSGVNERCKKAEEELGIINSADARVLAESSEPDGEEAWHRDNIRRFVEKANAVITAAAETGSRFTKFCFDGCVEADDMADWCVNEYIHSRFTPEILSLLRKAGYADASSPSHGTVIIRW